MGNVLDWQRYKGPNWEMGYWDNWDFLVKFTEIKKSQTYEMKVVKETFKVV